MGALPPIPLKATAGNGLFPKALLTQGQNIIFAYPYFLQPYSEQIVRRLE